MAMAKIMAEVDKIGETTLGLSFWSLTMSNPNNRLPWFQNGDPFWGEPDNIDRSKSWNSNMRARPYPWRCETMLEIDGVLQNFLHAFQTMTP